MNKSKLFMIYSVITLILVIVLSSGTYAWYAWSTSSSEKTNIATSVGAATVYFDTGGEINANLSPTDDKANGIVKTIKIKSNVTNELMFNLYLDINTLDAGLKDESFRYALYEEDSIVTEGNFSQEYLNSNLVSCNKNNTSHIVLLTNKIITQKLSTYTLYIWIDGLNYTNPNTMQNKNFDFKLHADGENAIIKEGQIPDITEIAEEDKGTLANKLIIDYYYAEKTSITNNGVVYYYDTTHNLMSDIGGNVRYYGASPNNYIYFNCSDYSNQSDTTCELWRIIGVFDGRVKIIRNSSIGDYSWDNKNTSTGAEVDSGKNDWTTARLMKLLNPSDYYEVDANDNGLGQSLYYNAQIGTCYRDQNNATISCDFTSSGLKNDITRNMIAEVTWNLGAWYTKDVYSDQIYTYERGTVVYSRRSTSWTGKIALMYPSDYGYAADFNSCTQTLGSYNSSTCKDNNWLYNSAFQWLLTTHSHIAADAWNVASSGSVGTYGAGVARGVRPVLYLNSNATIELGDGSSSLPYRLSVS